MNLEKAVETTEHAEHTELEGISLAKRCHPNGETGDLRELFSLSALF